MNKRIFTLLLAALLLLTASGCSKKQALPEQKTADILATTQPVYQLASALTDGTGLSVSLLISEPVSCLHDYTLTVSQMEKIEGAQLVLESGLGLEDFMEDALSGKTRIDISSGLPTLTGDGTPRAFSRQPPPPHGSSARSTRNFPTGSPRTLPRLTKSFPTCRPMAMKRWPTFPAASLSRSTTAFPILQTPLT